MSEPRPLWPALGVIEPGRDCYCDRLTLQRYAAEHGYSRAWRVGGQITSLQRRDGTYLKSSDNFPGHNADVDAFYAMLDECFSRGCFRPAAYHDPVYASVPMPRVKWTWNMLFAPQFAGGWNAALTRGVFHGVHTVYDIQSAYLSALAWGLPDPATYRYSERLQSAGLYVLDIEPRPDLPYPYNVFRRVNATADEIEVYDLRPVRVVGGVTWSRDWSVSGLTDAIAALSFWKYAARMYWGRWAMREQVEMVSGNSGTVTPLRSIFTNLPWAHLILSRIRMRLYHEVLRGDVRHVFTDSIITTKTRRITPHTVGGWKLVTVYPKGIHIRGPGQYGAMYSEHLDKHAGIPLSKRNPLI